MISLSTPALTWTTVENTARPEYNATTLNRATLDLPNGTTITYEVIRTNGSRHRLLIDGVKTGADAAGTDTCQRQMHEAERLAAEQVQAAEPKAEVTCDEVPSKPALPGDYDSIFDLTGDEEAALEAEAQAAEAAAAAAAAAAPRLADNIPDGWEGEWPTATERAEVEADAPEAQPEPEAQPDANPAPETATEPTADHPAGKMSALDAAAKVLQDRGSQMNAKALIAQMEAEGLWTSPGGKTPHATLYAAMIREIAKKGDKARFRKTDAGLFEYQTPAE